MRLRASAAQTMVMVAASSIILGTAGYVLTPHLLELLGVAPDVYQGALGFMRVSFTGIIFSLPLGILLALGRRSEMPAVRVFSVVLIRPFNSLPLAMSLQMADGRWQMAEKLQHW